MKHSGLKTRGFTVPEVCGGRRVGQRSVVSAVGLSSLRVGSRTHVSLVAGVLVFGAGSGNQHAWAQANATSPAQFGVSAGPVWHTVGKEGDGNLRGIGYDAAMGITVSGRVRVVRWLRVAAYYQRMNVTASIPAGAIDEPAARFDLDPLLCFSIGARLEPTLRVSERAWVWLSAGAGWGRMTSSKLGVTAPDRSYTVSEREGVFVELPFGIGGSFDVIPRWLAASIETTMAPNVAQSGTLFTEAQYVDSRGGMGQSPAFPRFGFTFTAMAGVSLLL